MGNNQDWTWGTLWDLRMAKNLVVHYDTQAKVTEATSLNKLQPQNVCPISCVFWNCRCYFMHDYISTTSIFPTIDLIFIVQTWERDGIGIVENSYL